MQIVSLTEARNNLKAVFNSVYPDNDEVIFHRKSHENIVVISFDEYNSIKETNYLLSYRNNADHLYKSMKQLHEGKTIEKDIDGSIK